MKKKRSKAFSIWILVCLFFLVLGILILFLGAITQRDILLPFFIEGIPV